MAEALSMDLRECLSQLQGPIPELQTLTNLLASSLAAYGILLPRYQQLVETSIPLSRNHKAVRLIPQFQLAILEQVLPNWEQALEENDLVPLVQQWFCPVSSSSEYATDVARHALSSILGVPLRQSTVAILERLLYHYPLSSIYCHFFPVTGALSIVAIDWDEYLKDIFSLPAKVANASGLGGIHISEPLENRFVAPFCSYLCSHQDLGHTFLTYVRGPRKSSGAYLIALVSKV
jgi:telomere length regulation protein